MCFIDILITVLSLIISGIISLVIALYVERAKLPRLKLTIANPSDQQDTNINARYLQIHISHVGIESWLRFFLQPLPALACVARLRFLREDGLEVMPTVFDARWTYSQQPPEFGQPIFPSVFEMIKRRDIFPKTEEKIDVCVKYNDEDDCYVFNNSYYTRGARAKEHRIANGIYTVEVTVACGEITETARFRLRNDFRRTDFRLETYEHGTSQE